VTMPFDVDRGVYTLAAVSSGGSTTHTETDAGVTSWFAELPPGVEFVRPTSGDAVTLTPPGSGGDEAAQFGETGLLESDNRPGDIYIGVPDHDLYQRVRVMLAGTVHVETWNGSAWLRR